MHSMAFLYCHTSTFASANSEASIPVQHAEEMTKRQNEYSKHFKTEIDYLTAEHEAEVKRLKASFSQAGTATSHISNHVSSKNFGLI